ncbi:unnamed protein product, partial [marine sediment metagenome]
MFVALAKKRRPYIDTFLFIYIVKDFLQATNM